MMVGGCKVRFRLDYSEGQCGLHAVYVDILFNIHERCMSAESHVLFSLQRA